MGNGGRVGRAFTVMHCQHGCTSVRGALLRWRGGRFENELTACLRAAVRPSPVQPPPHLETAPVDPTLLDEHVVQIRHEGVCDPSLTLALSAWNTDVPRCISPFG